MVGKMLYVLAGYDQATQGRLAGMQDKLYAKGFCGEHTRGIPMHVTLGSFPVEGDADSQTEGNGVHMQRI